MRKGCSIRLVLSILTLICLLLGVSFLLLRRNVRQRFGSERTVVATDATWPTQELPESTPAEEGFDPIELEKFFSHIETNLPYLDSVIIVRNGYIVREYYAPGRSAEMIENVWSVTKSLTSGLVGMAIQEGLIDNVDQRVGELLSAEQLAISHPKLKDVTVKQLLTLTAGNSCRRDSCAGQRANLVLARRFRHTPGTRFVYDTSSSQILSAIIANVSGMSLQEYAEKKLFEPLGFASINWDMDADGYTYGGRGMSLRPRDMAKFGQLYVDEGMWNGERLISAEYVQQSIINQVPIGASAEPVYGYLWWLGDAASYDAYTALGYGGQHIYVVPDLDLVVTITTNEVENYEENYKLVGDWVIPAIIDK